ncbi:hypothetical protein [Cellulomonas fimi]|uniref:DUF4352 domain-containing protein n=1 Tax=Cellulomonas fimi (strain ATCC 484 / DSM 20113 / JCM 1341 / CCUG 24087 / LMG 16345 / NBRC 15513 / NCIMB 8980 / NCTC 7547 / NRS-133) TaxID=590998 RepID=F4GZ41_CELFA|nr:hypothetical protein [Cellulomonas fimi]AEE47157.1 hypothetical protein Celf_3040 [Cellulomonas fimi ATCC 484]NNH07706.1 hypothetical protein [Cellulomonas fimi]VEH35435.1 Uncharacterised protein [Cellulomonas fimi]
MSAEPAVRRTPPRWLVVALAVLLVVVVAGAVWAAVARSQPGDDVAGGAAPTGSGTTSGDATPDPSAPVVTPTIPAPGEPGGGATDDADPAAPFEPRTEDAVPLDRPAAFDSGVTAELVRVEAVAGEAEGPGEVAGPAVRVTVRLTNGTAAAVPLTSTVVNVYGGTDRAPAEPLSGPGAKPFTGTLEPGASATGVLVFNVPADQRDPLQVTVSYDPTVTTVLFEGTGPAA